MNIKDRTRNLSLLHFTFYTLKEHESSNLEGMYVIGSHKVLSRSYFYTLILAGRGKCKVSPVLN